jgi:hypothetical protein
MGVDVWSLHELPQPPNGPDGAEELAIECCLIMKRSVGRLSGSSLLHMDGEKVLLATDLSIVQVRPQVAFLSFFPPLDRPALPSSLTRSHGNIQVNALPRNPAPYPVSCDPGPVRDSFLNGLNNRPLYSLRGGSVTMGVVGMDAWVRGTAVGAAEVLVLYSDKLRLYDFSP